MGSFVRNKFIIFLVSMCSLLFVSCEGNVEEKVQGESLEQGAVIQNDSGELSNFNLLDGSYSKVENDAVIGLYNSVSGSYISTKDGEYLYYSEGKEKKLTNIDSSSVDLKLSKEGSYLSYFTKKDGMFELELVSLKDDSKVEFDSHVYISSTYMDWLDDENIVYYGISDEKVNGIFVYNLKEKEESLFYRLDNGIVQYIKRVDKGLIFVHETINNQRLLKLINCEKSDVDVISSEVTMIKDIITIGDEYYFIGKVSGGVESIYKISSKKVKRIVFDFPAVIDVDKGLSKDKDNNLLFIGKSSKGSKQEEIYKVNSKGAISKQKDSAKEYSFVKYQ